MKTTLLFSLLGFAGAAFLGFFIFTTSSCQREYNQEFWAYCDHSPTSPNCMMEKASP